MEKASGKTYETFVRERIFQPLGMTSSRYDSTEAIVPRRARGYTRDDVDAIVPQSAVLRGIFQDVDLDFIHRVSVRVFDPFDPNDNLEFFYLDPVPFRGKTAIQLFPGIADVTAWFEAPYFGVETRLDYRQVTPTLITMRLEFTMRVLGKE